MQPPIPPPAVADVATNIEIMVWSASATTAAVLVALAVAVINLVQRRTDRAADDAREHKRSEAQARLVTFTSEMDDIASTLQWGGTSFRVTNHGDRAILDVTGEMWADGALLSGDPTVSTRPVVVASGEERLLLVTQRDNASISSFDAWRLRWTDADGRSWCWDQQPQETPHEYTGQPPAPSGVMSPTADRPSPD